MSLLKDVHWLLKSINDNYSNLILIFIATISAYVAYKEFILKRRPYVVPEISYFITKQDGIEDWSFNVTLFNKGTYPGEAKISNALLKVGDNNYPTIINTSVVLVPDEKQNLAPIGFINGNGLKKIRGHEFRSNTVEISVEVVSKSIGDTDYPYKTNYDFLVDVTGDTPIFSVISQSIK